MEAVWLCVRSVVWLGGLLQCGVLLIYGLVGYVHGSPVAICNAYSF